MRPEALEFRETVLTGRMAADIFSLTGTQKDLEMSSGG